MGKMSAMRFLGLIYALVLICGKGRTESAILNREQDQTQTASENSFTIQIPLGSGNVIQADNQVTPTVQRRLSLEDFFMNKNNQQQEQPQPAAPQEVPLTQFQVQQSDPNSLMLVRDAQFPSSSGGLVSRLLMARRMLRLRRIARRLSFVPRLFGLGLRQTLQRSALTGSPNPLSIFSKRIGEAYNPRDYVFGNKAFSYHNNDTSNTQQVRANTDQLQQQTRGYPVESEPYYDSNYDSQENSNYDSQELNELKKQQEILNSLTDEQQLLLLQQLRNYQQQLNQLQHQVNTQNNNNNNNNVQNYQNQAQLTDHQTIQYQQPQQNYQNIQSNQYQQVQPDQYQQVQPDQYQQVQQNQQQEFNEQRQEQIRQLELQLLREQQLQQQLQQLQLAQQANNLQQHQNLAAIEQENNFQDQNNQQQLVHENSQYTENNVVGDRTEGSSFSSPIGIGGSANSGKTVGVGINVGIKSPAIDIHVTKPVDPEIKHLPTVHKPAPAAEPLVPLGIFPKPILNLKGRLFFGAEMGKGVGIKAGVGR